ncbi:bifunctional diguanylate cyclase/phosphodiesterase [Massilia sp. Leaf139]|uniref:putative bifunctional diguanylate cyclase/phosphodiesterase n=1 Tax=Massilia sp. Leaf139 TaxID=1736272 RepID=UPI0012E95595|nr:bifunctional diguanylate cyclase/phosphodiesterase [Massilia sp. Leaf139]
MDGHAVLVVTADETRFLAFSNQLKNCSSTSACLQLILVAHLAIAKAYIAENIVDLIILDTAASDAGEQAALAGAIASLAPYPVMLWTTGPQAKSPSDSAPSGAAGHLHDAMAASDVMLQIFAIIARQAQARLFSQQTDKETAVTLEAIADGVICTDSRGGITFLNSAARRLLGFPDDQIIGRPVTEFMTMQTGGNRAPMTHPVHQVITTLHTVRIAAGTVLIRHDGTEIRIEDCCAPIVSDTGVLQGVVMVFHDTTEAYEMQARVDHLAWHDFLTGLPNRFAIHKHLDESFSHALTYHQQIPVLCLDLDKFKLINDTLGHGSGDKLLVSVAERLRACFRLIDLVGRQGGDEFIVVMAPGSSADDAILASARIIQALAKPYLIGGEEVRIGCSVGIAVYPQHGSTAELVLHHADVALQNIKANGRNGWCVFTEELHARTLERRLMEDGLLASLTDGSLSLFYQPKIRLADGKAAGCEALLRWQHPVWGWVAPTRFIPCAEASGLIGPLGRWVFDETLRQAQSWTNAGIEFGSIAINISAEELRHPDFVAYIRNGLATSGLAPERLQIELTESVLMQNVDHAGKYLNQLKELGVSLALDDFGTGYSSLSYLADFPIDVLKIDRSFIHRIDAAGTRQQALLHAILTLAKSLSLVVVAEGIETVEEENFLLQSGCQVGQGYYYSEPLGHAAYERFLASSAHADGPTVYGGDTG